MDPTLAMRSAGADDDEAPMVWHAPVMLEDVLEAPEEDGGSGRAEAAIDREIFGNLVTP